MQHAKTRARQGSGGRKVGGALLALLAAGLLPQGTACENYQAPPEPSIEGLDADGVLKDPAAPVVVRFDRPIARETLRLKVAEFVTDSEYRLADEPENTLGTEFKPLFVHEPTGDTLGSFRFLDDTRVELTAATPFPVGPQLVLLVEPGLRGTNGIDTVDRRKNNFSYVFTCSGRGKPGPFTSGNYFMLVEVIKPLGLQIQLYASLKVDPATGAVVGQFTNADRNPAQKCPMECDKKVCRLLPSPSCVQPSEKAGTIDEYPDFVPNNVLPTGYSFPGEGCVDAQADGSVRFRITSPQAVVNQPKVTINEILIVASFKPDDKGVLRATGGFNARGVDLFDSPSGAGKGDLTAIRVPDELAPPGIPEPGEVMPAQ
jgi:hypothetical protein